MRCLFSLYIMIKELLKFIIVCVALLFFMPRIFAMIADGETMILNARATTQNNLQNMANNSNGDSSYSSNSYGGYGASNPMAGRYGNGYGNGYGSGYDNGYGGTMASQSMMGMGAGMGRMGMGAIRRLAI